MISRWFLLPLKRASHPSISRYFPVFFHLLTNKSSLFENCRHSAPGHLFGGNLRPTGSGGRSNRVAMTFPAPLGTCRGVARRRPDKLRNSHESRLPSTGPVAAGSTETFLKRLGRPFQADPQELLPYRHGKMRSLLATRSPPALSLPKG